MTSDEFLLLLRRFIEGMQLPAALSGLSQIAKQSKDPAANHISQMAMVAATAAETDTKRLIELLTQVPAFVQTQSSSTVGATIYSGTDIVEFGGGMGENNASTGITGATWVTADTEVIGYIPYEPVTSDPPSYFFQVARDDLNVGAGFNFMVYNPNTPSAQEYTIQWIAFVPD